ncbi:hypothetical protein GCM10009733_021000 [Nonomuraea maheshkhaliensis]|uniref:Uncharacterized protein n=1 Tax=Nonomuraea maheshkhaliensis TaxID=419590 RepID=A0ABP4QXD6_9ACTN
MFSQLPELPQPPRQGRPVPAPCPAIAAADALPVRRRPAPTAGWRGKYCDANIAMVAEVLQAFQEGGILTDE